MAVQDYELLLRVRADLLEAISGLKGLTTELGQGDAAASKLGESADQASDRIKAMVQASLDQQRAMQGSSDATRQAGEQSNAIVREYDQQTSAANKAAAAQVNYNKSFTQGGGNPVSTAGATAAISAQRAEMAKLAGQIDPTVAALAKLDAQERSLAAMQKSGVVGAEDYAAFKAVIDQNRAALTGAAGAAEKFAFASAGAKREYGVLIGELARGNTARLEGSLLTLANRTGFLTALFSPLGVAVLAVAGTMGAFAIAAIKGSEETDQFNKAIAQTGNFAGVTAADMNLMAHDITTANGSIADSRTALTVLAASGKVGGDSLKSMGQAAVNMAELTGVSTDKAAQAVLTMFDGTAASAAKADEQYHFLTTSIYDQIKALQDEGDTQQAMDVAAQAFNDAAIQRQQQLQAELSATGSWWDKIKKKASDAWEAMKSDGDVAIALGVANDQQQIADLQKRKAAATPDASGHIGSVAGVVNNMLGLGFGDKEQAQLDALQAKVAKSEQDAKDAGTKQELTSGAVQADAQLDTLEKSVETKADRVKDKIKELNDAYTKLWAGADPNNAKLQGVQRNVNDDGSVSFAGGQYDKDLANIQAQDKTKTPRAKRNPQDAIDKSAATAQQQLIESLGDVQGKLDPTAAAWAAYNKEVDKANKLAETAAKGTGANVEAINAERDAYVAAAAKVRDASIAKEAEKDQQAWDKLRKTLGTPTDAKVETAIAQIKQLNEFLAKGVIDAKQYQDALKKVGQNSVVDAPKYKGVNAAVGGPASEIGKNSQAAKELAKWHKQQLADNDAFRNKDAANEQVYQSRKADIEKQYAEQSKLIEQGRQQLILTATSNWLGNMAELQHSSNNKIAKIGKAAAIAQAMINTYQSATAAFSAMASIPYVGPFLGAAAAAVAIAVGLANVNQIRAQPNSFSIGGYTGPGGVNQPAGVVHKGEVVWSQADIARAGGVGTVEAMRMGQRGYAMGGYVDSWFATPSLDATSNPSSLPGGGTNGAPPSAGKADAGQTHIHVWSIEDAAEKLASSPTMQKAVVHIVGDNPRTIQGKWGR